jgi:transcriptional regulator with XRE-family HTH domain
MTERPFNSAVNERTLLIAVREGLRLTRPELAKMIGTSRGNIYRIEIGERHPSLALMQRWVKALGDGATLELFKGKGAKTRPSRGRLPYHDDAA